MMDVPGWLDDRSGYVPLRKVRTPQGNVPGNTRDGATRRIGPQRHTASYLRVRCKGEKVVQETTGASSDVCGQATPTWSKVKQRQSFKEVAARHLNRKVHSLG